MTKNLAEDSLYTRAARNEFGTRQLFRRPQIHSGVAVHEIKVFEDITAVVVGDNAFVWEVPEDLDGATLLRVGGFLSTEGSSSTQVAIRLTDCDGVGGDILDDKITIEAGECSSKTAATQPAVADNTVVAWGDLLHIDVDLAGGGALGLGVHIIYANFVGSIGFTGTQGPPGGVTQYQGQYPGGPGAAGTPGGAGSTWTTTTNYVVGDVVENGGTFYVATANHTSSALTEPGVGANWMTVWEPLVYNAGDIVTNNGTLYVVTVTHTATTATVPGVGVDWETVFAPLFETAVYSGVDIAMSGGGFALSIGRKAMAIVPFDCEIVEATLLADQAGNAVVDIWKDTYGNHPPTVADSITSASPPTLVGASKTTDTTLSGWTTTLTAGDILIINIDSVSNVNLLTLALRLLRTP